MTKAKPSGANKRKHRGKWTPPTLRRGQTSPVVAVVAAHLVHRGFTADGLLDPASKEFGEAFSRALAKYLKKKGVGNSRYHTLGPVGWFEFPQKVLDAAHAAVESATGEEPDAGEGDGGGADMGSRHEAAPPEAYGDEPDDGRGDLVQRTSN